MYFEGDPDSSYVVVQNKEIPGGLSSFGPGCIVREIPVVYQPVAAELYNDRQFYQDQHVIRALLSSFLAMEAARGQIPQSSGDEIGPWSLPQSLGEAKGIMHEFVFNRMLMIANGGTLSKKVEWLARVHRDRRALDPSYSARSSCLESSIMSMRWLMTVCHLSGEGPAAMGRLEAYGRSAVHRMEEHQRTEA